MKAKLVMLPVLAVEPQHQSLWREVHSRDLHTTFQSYFQSLAGRLA